MHTLLDMFWSVMKHFGLVDPPRNRDAVPLPSPLMPTAEVSNSM